MTKHEAIAAMRQGFAVTHELFTSDEYLYMGVNTFKMYDENGNELPYEEFWDYRSKPVWEKGWSIYKVK